jgi:hypothetical protein
MKRLVDLVVLLQRVPELVTESLDDPEEGHNYLLRFSSDPDSNIAATELLAAVWSESNRLPLQHRRTLFFTFDDGAGESLLHLLRRSGVITIDDAVKSLEMGHRELEGIWDGLPLSITEAAAVLETTKGNIKKWRHRATTKLAGALGITDARKPKAR